jgi:hypothetical protein
MRIKEIKYRCGCPAVWGDGLRVRPTCMTHGAFLETRTLRSILRSAKGVKPRKPASPRKLLEKENDVLWSRLVKLRAGECSEYSGRSAGYFLASHHLRGKSGLHYGIRWEPLNGYCCTSGEHKFGFHGTGREKYEKVVKAQRGQDIFDRLEYLAMTRKRQDLAAVKLMLQGQIKNIEAGIKP